MSTIDDALARGFAHHRAGDLRAAEQIYRQVLAEHPAHAEALHRLGALALQTGHAADAVRLLEQAISIEPNLAEYHHNLGSAYLTLGRNDEARGQFDEAIRLDPAMADGHYNLGLALYALGRLEEAAASYRRSLQLRPENPFAHNNLGDLLRELGSLDEALAHLNQAVALAPEYAKAHYNRSLVWLSQGRLAEGWAEYEWRLQCLDVNPRKFAEPQWNGEPLGDRRLLVHAEQGLGDTFQFVRYLPLAIERCRHVTFEAPAALLPLLTASGLKNLVSPVDPRPPADAQISLMSLARIFSPTLDTIPNVVPYLAADRALSEHWRGELSKFAGYRVGIFWQGRTSYREDRFRSVALSQFAPLAQVSGARLFSLQKGPGSEQISAVQGRFHVVDLGSAADERSGPFMDTAAIMKNLDLIVTTDTAGAHLAGALGVPVWCALRSSPDWRWLADRDDSPWYPTMRLFRQTSAGDWPGVFRRMAAALSQLVGKA
jgi:tetratricopeptide (TPR) repeat protein